MTESRFIPIQHRVGATNNRFPETIVDAGSDYTYADTNAWLTIARLPPILPGELEHQWAIRTLEQRGVGKTALSEVQTKPANEPGEGA